MISKPGRGAPGRARFSLTAMADAPKSLTFRALQLANEQRTLYGLRYNDYERYRKHCANRTHRLRSTLKATHGKGREFKKSPVVPQDKIQDGHLQLVLFEAERAWSYSQELLALAADPANSSKASALRHNATGRFRRAVHWATQLLSQCQALHDAGRLGAAGLLEATVYTLVLNGRFLRYREELDDALVQLAVARAILDTLADRAATSRDQALATYFADEVGPEIRYCAHELGHAKAYDVDGIVRERAAQHRAQLVDGYDDLVAALKGEAEAGAQGGARTLRPLVWEGEPVPVRNPELVDVLVKVQEGEVKLREESVEVAKPQKTEQDKKRRKPTKGSKSKRGVAAYDNILLALSDAEDVARRLAEAQNASGSSSGLSAPGVRDIHFIHVFIVYHLLARRIQRDMLLISTLLAQSAQASRKPTAGKPGSSKGQKEAVDTRLYPAVVKLFDTILQSLTQMRALPIVDESPDLAAAVDVRISYTNARRCRYLALTYIPVKRYGEALTLLQRGTIHLREARTALSTTAEADPIASGDPAFYPLAPGALEQLDAELAADAAQHKADWFTHNGGAIGADNRTYKKPLFFDVALNYVQLDMDRLQARAGKKPAPAAVVAPAPVRAEPAVDKRPVAKAKVEEVLRPATPEPSAHAKGGLSSLLGGWWGRQ
ncbi:hypothetical protein BC834DRAFT_860324 [Gloeopeniophorella convolvens]|nr:hypothetical protein BC834DRAFT_860324 [Gloeopeniophorella convolvens]